MNQYNIAEIVKPLVHKSYWGVELITKDNIRTPRFWNGNEFEYVGINDSKCSIAYVRELEDMEPVKQDIGGCKNDYNYRHKLRLVIYIRDYSGDKNAFIQSLVNDLSFREIVIRKIISDSNKLVRFESDFGKKLILTGKDLYIGVDLELSEEKNNCCPEIINNCTNKPNCI